MFGKKLSGAGAFVLGVDDDAASRQAVREAAELAWREGATLHLVVAYILHDSWQHRAARTNGPCDTAYQMSPKADAAIIVHELASIATQLGVEVQEHVYRGSLKAGIRKVTKDLAKAPAPVRVPVAPAPVPALLPVPAGRRISPPRFVRAAEVVDDAATLASSLAEPHAASVTAR